MEKECINENENLQSGEIPYLLIETNTSESELKEIPHAKFKLPWNEHKEENLKEWNSFRYETIMLFMGALADCIPGINEISLEEMDLQFKTNPKVDYLLKEWKKFNSEANLKLNQIINQNS